MTAQQNQQAQVVQQNQQLQNDVILLKARVFDAEEAIKRSDNMLRALSQEAQQLASVLNEEASLELRKRLVQVAPSFGNGLISTEDTPAQEPVKEPKQAKKPAPKQTEAQGGEA